ncbi:hypothetical protein COY00_00975, partial [Candidatus Pacearchaeota archaeon CG_4_10_14_0_2_um_filter_35_33]
SYPPEKKMDADESRLRMAVIAGAAKACRYKDEHPRASEQEVVQNITDNVKEILDKIDNPF